MDRSIKLSFGKLLGQQAGAVLLLFFAAGFSFAQSTDRISVSTIRNDIRFNEWQLKNLGRTRQPPVVTEPIAWEQVRRDFLELQIANGNLQRSFASGGENIDYRLFKVSLTQIKKRGTRLKENLLLPIPKATKEELKNQSPSLVICVVLLDETIVRFSSNSVFKQSKVINADDEVQAGRDLRLILTLSEHLKEQLSKISPKTGR